MSQYVVDDEGFFEDWQATWAGRFLASHPSNPKTPIVDTDMLAAHAPRLSHNLQISTGIWWNVVMQSPAPWISEPLAELSQVSWQELRAIQDLMAGVRLRLDPLFGRIEHDGDDR